MFKTGLYFQCQLPYLPHTSLEVVDFELEEGLSQLFKLKLHLVSSDASIDLHALILKKAALLIYTDGRLQRRINGVISIAKRGKTGFRRTHYTLTIRPPLWLLTQRHQSRIFHQRTVPEILNQLLQEHYISFEHMLYQPHVKREYTVQKRENDFDFFSRLAAEEGIVFWFENKENRDLCFYSDSQLGYRDGVSLTYNDHPRNLREGHYLYDLSFSAAMAPQYHLGKDRTYLNPDYDFEHDAFISSEQGGDPYFYVHYDSYARFPDDKVGKDIAKYRLEALQVRQELGEAKSNSPLVMPGTHFQINAHPDATINRQWQAVTVHHIGQQPAALEEESDGKPTTLTNDITFISSQKAWRAPFRHKPLADGPEIAEVVGPEGEEIFTNELGQVKVHFHWNRHDKPDDRASCWVRVAQGWNGDQYGFYAVPRIGQEVIITYLDGDIDRPMITGCTFNAKNRVPLDLPTEKTRTIFRTKTHKGTGFNQLYFEDQQGQEELAFHAEKEMKVYVKHDQIEHILHDQHTEIENARFVQINSDDNQTIQGDQKIHIQGEQAILVEGELNQKHQSAVNIDIATTLNQRVAKQVVIDAGAEICLKVGSHFIKIDGAGITFNGNVKFAEGGQTAAPLPAKGELPQLPQKLNMFFAHAQVENPGHPETESPDVIPMLRFKLAPLPLMNGYPNEYYKLYRDGQFVEEGITDEEGYFYTKKVPDSADYAVELINGNRFDVQLIEQFEADDIGQIQQLKTKGFIYSDQIDDTAVVKRWQNYLGEKATGKLNKKNH